MTTAARTLRMLARSGPALRAPLSSSFAPLQEAVPRALDPSCAVRSVNTDGGGGAASIKEDEPHFRTVNVTSSGEGMACRHQAVKHEVRKCGFQREKWPLIDAIAKHHFNVYTQNKWRGHLLRLCIGALMWAII